MEIIQSTSNVFGILAFISASSQNWHPCLIFRHTLIHFSPWKFPPRGRQQSFHSNVFLTFWAQVSGGKSETPLSECRCPPSRVFFRRQSWSTSSVYRNWQTTWQKLLWLLFQEKTHLTLTLKGRHGSTTPGGNVTGLVNSLLTGLLRQAWAAQIETRSLASRVLFSSWWVLWVSNTRHKEHYVCFLKHDTSDMIILSILQCSL